MGGFWQLVFVCCLLVQSLSAEDPVNDNSTSAADDNSASAADDNSTSAVDDNSASEVDNNSASVVDDNSASAVDDNSTSAVDDNSASVVDDNSTSVADDNSTSVADDNSTSAVDPDEELENIIREKIASMQQMGEDEILKLIDAALHYHNTQEASVSTIVGDPTVTVKKAVGSFVHMGMILEKTNCTKKDMKEHDEFGALNLDPEEGPPKYCGPLAGHDKEQLDCRFEIFKDERSYTETVVGHDCKPVKIMDKEIFNGENIKS